MNKLDASSSCEDVIKALDSPDLSGQVYIVTGSNTGIGKELVYHLSKLKAKVIIACRTVSKGQDARKELLQRSDDVLDIEVFELDLNDLKSCEAFYENFPYKDRVSCLVLNAGICATQYNKTVQGYEQTFGVNHLGHFYLTNLFRETLLENNSRVVVVSSGSHYGPVHFKNFEDEQAIIDQVAHYGKESTDGLVELMKVYGTSKYCNVLFAKELYERYGIPSCSLHPGNMIGTDISRNQNFVVRFLYDHVISMFTKTINQGASTSLLCSICDPKLLTGNYWDGNQTKQASKHITKTQQKALWNVSDNLVSKL